MGEWARAHQHRSRIDTWSLSRDLRDIDRYTLAFALDLLVEKGYYRERYTVLTPSGVLADAEFEDPTEIPAQLPDRFHRYFDTAESEVVTVLAPA